MIYKITVIIQRQKLNIRFFKTTNEYEYLMMDINNNDQSLIEIFENARTVVIVGCSDKQYRTSYHIAEYLIASGYSIIPVNPNIDETLGENAYDEMDDLPEDLKVDIVNIFRNKRYTDEMVRQIIRWSKKTGQKPLIWTQLNVSTPAAQEIAITAGLQYVENKCMMVEHKRLVR